MANDKGGVLDLSPSTIPVTESKSASDLLKRARVETQPCWLCRHCIVDRPTVMGYLRARGVTQASSGAPGENTLARDFRWGPLMRKLDALCICRRPNVAGTELVHYMNTCSLWELDSDRLGSAVDGMAAIGK